MYQNTTKIYFKGYFPTKTSINTIEKINAVVEKLAGRINIKVIKTGNQSSLKDCTNSIGSVRVLDKYRATKTYNIKAAKAEG